MTLIRFIFNHPFINDLAFTFVQVNEVDWSDTKGRLYWIIMVLYSAAELEKRTENLTKEMDDVNCMWHTKKC